MARLPRQFFTREATEVARSLLGNVLVRVVGGTRLSGAVVEAEAYRGSDDAASHAANGITDRNSVMFGEAGHAYVYFSYGVHHCLNVSTGQVGAPGAVLIRAVEPMEGTCQMLRNRGAQGVTVATNGPGKLAQALQIDRRLNGEDMVKSADLFFERGKAAFDVGESRRVGVRAGADLRWRYFVAGNPFVSPEPAGAHRIHNYRAEDRKSMGSSASL